MPLPSRFELYDQVVFNLGQASKIVALQGDVSILWNFILIPEMHWNISPFEKQAIETLQFFFLLAYLFQMVS